MKYVGIVLLCLLAVKLKAKPNTNSPAINPTKQEADDYAAKLSEMIKVPTISLRGNTDLSQFYKLHEVMRESFPNVFAKMECTEIEGNLLLRLPGKAGKRNSSLRAGRKAFPRWRYYQYCFCTGAGILVPGV